ncbi:hypothetical protein M758_4G166600 [Ceratodon purpureus]|nr:hypothetical protein M758_4G166600 [Ceratodon purpureus]
MEALRTSGVGVLSSTRVGDAAVSSTVDVGQCVSFSSSAVFGGPVRNQVASAGWAKKRREGSGACQCVAAAAAAADEFVTVGGSAGTLYSVLGVELGGSFSDIKSAYKQMARRYHPDVCPLDDRDACTQKFLEVRHAYEILSDPEKRAEYDYALMHPSFAQALGNSSTSSWGRSRRTQGSEGVSDAWRFQWEAQLSRLRRDSEVKSSPVSNSNSWGARMRREKSEH